MEEYRNHNEPWDPSIYGTGRTQPPKNHGGLIAVLLVVVIFLGGLVSVLGILNVKLFKELNSQPKQKPASLTVVEAAMPICWKPHLHPFLRKLPKRPLPNWN